MSYEEPICWGCSAPDAENCCEHCCAEICEECSYLQPGAFVLCKDCHDQVQEDGQQELRKTGAPNKLRKRHKEPTP